MFKNIASLFGNKEIAQLLIENDADINIRDHLGYTSLMIGIYF